MTDKEKYSEGIKRYNMWHDVIVCILISLLFFLPTIMHEIENAWVGGNLDRIDWGRIFEPFLCVVIFMVNYYVILRKALISRRNWCFFIVCNLLLIILMLFIHEVLMVTVFDTPKFSPPPRIPALTQSEFISGVEFKHFFKIKFVVKEVSMFILSIAVAVTVKVIYYYGEMRRQEIEAEAERRQIELMGLKAQLNPHFLFNTLNNIYALIEIAPNSAQKAIHDLSAMLRYMIYEANTDEVPLNRDLNFVKDYIELMKLRISPSLKLTVNISDKNSEHLRVTPLLFLTLIENAFKHVATNGDDAQFIDIKIETSSDSIECVVTNSYNSNREQLVDRFRGVGLKNIKRQLQMLYADRYSLDIDADCSVYKVKLKIRLI